MICRFCGADIDGDAKFCLKCGKRIGHEANVEEKPRRFCTKCGAEIEADASFCLKCGHNTEIKKKPIGLIVAIVIVLAIGIAGGTGIYLHQKAVKAAYEAELAAERQRQAEIHAYQSKAIEVFDEINASKSNFNLMSTMYSTSTELNTGLLGPSFFTSYVEGLCASELSTEKMRKREVDALLSELNGLGCNEPEVTELKKVIENYYYSYEDRYKLLVEGDFSVYSFSSEEKASASDFETKFKDAQEEINNIDRDALENIDETDVQIEGEGGSTI